MNHLEKREKTFLLSKEKMDEKNMKPVKKQLFIVCVFPYCPYLSL